MIEKWKTINDYENYEISNYGYVRRKNNNKILKQYQSSRGYLFVILYNDNGHKTKYIHKLVAEHFIGKANTNLQVNHIDGNKRNNTFINLEYLSAKENMQHAIKNNLWKPSNERKVVMCDKTNNKELHIFKSIRKAEEYLGVKHNGNITSCCKGNKLSIYGYKWKYLEG